MLADVDVRRLTSLARIVDRSLHVVLLPSTERPWFDTASPVEYTRVTPTVVELAVDAATDLAHGRRCVGWCRC